MTAPMSAILPRPLEQRVPTSIEQWRGERRNLESKTIVFVTGPMKSGTTWLTSALAAHPEIAIAFESQAMNGLAPRLRSAVAEWRAERQSWGLPPEPDLDPVDVEMLISEALDRILLRTLAEARREGRDPTAIVEKSPMHALHIERLAAMHPDARFICCARDLRDCAVSAWHYLRGLGRVGPEVSVERWARDFARRVLRPAVLSVRAASARIDPTRMLTSVFEQRIEDPEANIREALAFIGVASDLETVRACVNAASFRNLSGGRERGSDVDEPSFFRKGVAGDWKSVLTEEEGEQILRLASQDERADAERRQWRSLWRQVEARLDAMGARRIALYGAGAHTRRLLGDGWGGSLRVAAIIDDHSTEPEIHGHPVVRPDAAPGEIDAVLLSSDSCEPALRRAAERTFSERGVPIVGVYEDV